MILNFTDKGNPLFVQIKAAGTISHSSGVNRFHYIAMWLTGSAPVVSPPALHFPVRRTAGRSKIESSRLLFYPVVLLVFYSLAQGAAALKWRSLFHHDLAFSPVAQQFSKLFRGIIYPCSLK
jgi:hypothetical protein